MAARWAYVWNDASRQKSIVNPRHSKALQIIAGPFSFSIVLLTNDAQSEKFFFKTTQDFLLSGRLTVKERRDGHRGRGLNPAGPGG